VPDDEDEWSSVPTDISPFAPLQEVTKPHATTEELAKSFEAGRDQGCQACHGVGFEEGVDAGEQALRALFKLGGWDDAVVEATVRRWRVLLRDAPA
jgi:flagellar biosynthesis/type III secretory pathway protein FliH